MLRNRTIVFIAILALLLGALGLVGCSSSDEPAEETESTEASTEESADAGSNDALVGTWENAEGTYFSAITFASDGTGTGVDIDGTEAPATWTLEDDYLEVTIEYDGMTDTTGGGFTWEEEGVIFVWDADGTFTKVD